MGEQVQVIDRTLDILEYLSLTQESKGPTEIAKAVGLNKSTVHRLLAALSGGQLEFFMADCGFEQYTPKSITGMRELKEHLRAVRNQNWAIDNEEYLAGHRCVGAPVCDYRGEVIAAVSASGPVALLTDERIPEVVEQVKRAAALISRKLCYSDYSRE